MLIKFKFLVIFSLGFISLATAGDLDQKRTGTDGQVEVEGLTEFYQVKELSQFTSMKVKLMPDKGTRLIFPFILTDESLTPTLNIRNSNGSVFSVTAKDDVTGQPVIDLEYIESIKSINDRVAKSGWRPNLGQVHISIGSYKITIALESTLKPSEVVPNYVFQITEPEREHLIDAAVARYKEAIDREYQSKFDDLDQLAEKLAVNYIADVINSKPKIRRIKDEQLSEDKQLSLYVDQVEVYNERYGIIRFELANKTGKTFDLTSIRFVGMDGDIVVDIDGTHDCGDVLEKRGILTCVFVSDDITLASYKRIKTEIVASDNNWSFQW